MNQNLKIYLLHLRDILDIVPYLSLRITGPMFWKWITSFKFDIGKAVLVFRQKKHRFILDYLEERYSYLLPEKLSYNGNQNMDEKLPIWVCWYQGEASMPPLVKMCYHSVLRNARDRPVHLLDKDNILEYADIPDYILKGYAQGILTIQNFSDILRLTLLAKYGGHWLDATLYINKPLTEEGLNPYFESIKMPEQDKGTISRYRWSTFCLYAKPQASTIIFFRNIMLAYFRDGHKRIIDYLLIDYSFQMLYEKNIEFRKLIDSRPRTNCYTYALNRNLNKDYSPEYMKKWKDQPFFKLSWRKHLDEGDTLFHYLEAQYK